MVMNLMEPPARAGAMGRTTGRLRASAGRNTVLAGRSMAASGGRKPLPGVSVPGGGAEFFVHRQRQPAGE